MTHSTSPDVAIYEMDTPESVEAAANDLARRCNELPAAKKLFLRETLMGNPELELATISLLVLMLENSDDDFNITNPAVQQMIDDAQTAHELKETRHANQ